MEFRRISSIFGIYFGLRAILNVREIDVQNMNIQKKGYFSVFSDDEV